MAPPPIDPMDEMVIFLAAQLLAERSNAALEAVQQDGQDNPRDNPHYFELLQCSTQCAEAAKSIQAVLPDNQRRH